MQVLLCNLFSVVRRDRHGPHGAAPLFGTAGRPFLIEMIMIHICAGWPDGQRQALSLLAAMDTKPVPKNLMVSA